MKRFFFFILLAALGLSLLAEEAWHSGTVESGLSKAKKEDKVLFLKFYSDACSWCKILDREVLTPGNMNSFSKLFVMMKINTKSDEGKALREKYAIQGVPTIVLLDQNGTEIDRIVGYERRDAWVREILGYAFNVGTLADLKTQADEKKNGELFYRVAMKYFDRGSYPDSSVYIAKAKSDPSNSEELKGSIALLEGECLLQTEPDKGRKLLREIMAGPDKDKAEAAFEDLAGYYRKMKDHDGTVSIFKEMLLKKGDDKDFLNSYAWTLAEIGRELESAAEAARKAVELSKQDPQILDTLAEVYFKMGNKKLAVETIDKAIAKEPEDEYYKEQKAKFLE